MRPIASRRFARPVSGFPNLRVVASHDAHRATPPRSRTTPPKDFQACSEPLFPRRRTNWRRARWLMRLGQCRTVESRYSIQLRQPRPPCRCVRSLPARPVAFNLDRRLKAEVIASRPLIILLTSSSRIRPWPPVKRSHRQRRLPPLRRRLNPSTKTWRNSRPGSKD